MELFSRVDLSIPPSRRFGVSVGREVEEALGGRLSSLRLRLESTTNELHHFSRQFWGQSTDQACAVIFNHALNDFNILVRALWEGDGRTAARTSRSLYEHLVNYCYIAGEVEKSDRYMTHRAVTHQLISNLQKRLPLLRKSQRQREAHRRNKLGRDSARDYQDAIDLYGTGFKKDWSKENLYDRAKKNGLEGDYDIYRLLSQVTHGSTGGTLGTVRRGDGPTVHRMGPSIELAVITFPEGLSFFRDLCRQIESRSSVDSRNIVDSLNELIAGWGVYKEACEWVDKNLWPDSPPLPATAILAIFPNGGTRWFLWEPSLGLMTAAKPPANAAEIEEQAKEHWGFTPDGTHTGDDEGRPITVSVLATPVTIERDAKWIPAEAILQPKIGAESAESFLSTQRVFSKFGEAAPQRRTE
ncbi:DUF5677 domain-containing protein [Streptomyces goshikiensis]|uniref:DUF5677 domain-containing protein n=1 Tax=Streptomyces goshikiensis TaxID=1942 RepID=UPI0037CD8721